MLNTSRQGLPQYMLGRNVTREYDVRDNPTELDDRLKLLVTKREAENINHEN